MQIHKKRALSDKKMLMNKIKSKMWKEWNSNANQWLLEMKELTKNKMFLIKVQPTLKSRQFLHEKKQDKYDSLLFSQSDIFTIFYFKLNYCISFNLELLRSIVSFISKP